MGKAENTKGFILNKSRKVFCEKGYAKVTMKDLCEATGLSRGGLYRYYSSTKEIFLDQLKLHKINSEKLLDNAIRSKVPAQLLIEGFFSDLTNEILNAHTQITFAVYEFSIHEKDYSEIFKERFEEAVRILSKLLEYAKENGVIKIESCSTISKHIIYTAEGLKIARSVFNLSAEEVDNQLSYIKSLLHTTYNG